MQLISRDDSIAMFPTYFSFKKLARRYMQMFDFLDAVFIKAPCKSKTRW